MVMPAAPQPSTPLVGKESHPPRPELLKPETQGSPQAILVTLYRGVLKLVQSLTAVLLRKNHTLREYAQECAPKLGPLAAYFQELTDLIEKALYARKRPEQADAVRGTKLTRKLFEGIEHESS